MKVFVYTFLFVLLAAFASAADEKDVGDACSKDDDCGSDRLECVFPTTGPTEEPAPTGGTNEPTDAPTAEPTDAPTAEPTDSPTAEPTDAPTAEPTDAPTAEPTDAPTAEPTDAPTAEPTDAPTAEPTNAPTTESTDAPGPNPEPDDKSRRRREVASDLGRLALYFKSLSADQGKCQCKGDYELSNDKKHCRKAILQEESYACEKDVDCEVIKQMPVNGYEKADPKYNKCNEDSNVCECGKKDEAEEWFVADYLTDTVCIHQTGNYSCSKESECGWLRSEMGNTNATCIDKQCECDDEDNVAFWPNSDEPQRCERKLGGYCTNDDQCSHIEHATCSDDNECSCGKNYETDSDDKLFSCEKKSGASTIISSILLLISSVWLGRWTS